MRGYTLQELADLTGLTHGYVRDLECLTIDKTPTLETIGKFADALEIDIRQLFDEVNTDKFSKLRILVLFYYLFKKYDKDFVIHHYQIHILHLNLSKMLAEFVL